MINEYLLFIYYNGIILKNMFKKDPYSNIFSFNMNS